MPTQFSTSADPRFARAASNIGQAIFGAPVDPRQVMNDRLTAARTAEVTNRVAGQNKFRDILEATQGDLNNIDGGTLAAAVGLAKVNPNIFTTMALDPRFGEDSQRRISVGAGKSPSMGSIAADVGLDQARTRLADARAANVASDTGGKKNYKPPQLVPANVQKIRDAALANLGLDSTMFQNTVEQTPDLGKAVLDIISGAHTSSQGNAAATESALQDMMATVLRRDPSGGNFETAGEWNPFSSNRFVVNEQALVDLLSTISTPNIASTVGRPSAPAAPPAGGGVRKYVPGRGVTSAAQ